MISCSNTKEQCGDMESFSSEDCIDEGDLEKVYGPEVYFSEEQVQPVVWSPAVKSR